MKQYIKVFCKKKNCYGLITIEENNGSHVITNFYEIDEDTAKNIKTSYNESLPMVSSHLKPCSTCGKRVPRSCDKTKQCKVEKGQLWYQCLYCSGIEVCQDQETAGGAHIFFLMDNSGSMSEKDRIEGANAVRKMIQSLQGLGNTYSFVPWGSDAGYLFYGEQNISKISSALGLYEQGLAGHGGSTAAHLAFDYIRGDVSSSKVPVRILLVTDGGFDSEFLAVDARNGLLNSNENIEILAIGVTGANASNLEKIGTVPAFSKVIGSSAALSDTFEQIAEILKKKGNNF